MTVLPCGPRPRRQPRRPGRGFTLIECLVVLAIIGLLIILLLPAVSNSREAARRSQCIGYLKQIGLGVHNYHAVNDSLPSGDLGGWSGWSAQARLLPFLEQGQLYSAINFSFGNRIPNDAPWEPTAHTEINSTVIGTRINSFLCPSTPAPVGGNLTFAPSGVARPGNSYFASMGPSLHFRGELTQARPAGLFMNDGPAIGLHDISDGTANTLMFGEWRIGDGNPNRLSPQDVIAMGAPGPNNEVNPWDARTMTMACGDANGAFRRWLATIPAAAQASVGEPTRNKSWLGEQWSSGLCGLAMGNTLLPPNPPFNNAQIFGAGVEDFDTPGIYGLSSYHSGGCNVAMADGSVRFLKSRIDMAVLWALGSRAQDEPLSSDSY